MSMVVVNGYFRSGTSILWRLLRQANQGRSLVYEPCHNDLFGAIELARGGYQNTLHEFAVWEDYLALPESQLERLRWTHPCVDGRILPGDSEELLRYVAVLSELFGASAVLQTNRWHFHLAVLTAAGIDAVHVIRNPLAVYRSIQRGSDYRRRRNPLIRARAVLNPADQFYGWRMAAEIAPQFGHRLSAWQRYRPFDVFVYCWVLANLSALENLGPERIFSYEEICLAPERFQHALRKLGLDIDCSSMRSPTPISPAELALVDEACHRLDIDRFWKPLRYFLVANHARLPMSVTQTTASLVAEA